MRESFGGAFIIKLLLVFIIVYVSFMAIAINYAKAFRVKNGVINTIEQNQYTGGDDQFVIGEIDKYLSSVSYIYKDDDYRTIKDNCDSYLESILTSIGVCIVPLGDKDARYYKVITYIAIDFPFFGIELTIPISGETKMIYTS